MKIYEPNDKPSIREILDHLNVCHDGVIRRITFMKDREYNEYGDVSFPCEEDGGDVNCDIDIELLLNSYIGASTRQMVVFSFKGVKFFNFFQESSFDYSWIHELTFHQANNGTFDFSFCVSSNMIKILTLNCTKVICKEYVESQE
jgi:hypothetical protein